MSDPPLWARTQEQMARMHAARKQGGLCAWCGRRLDDGETVYVESARVGVERTLRN